MNTYHYYDCITHTMLNDKEHLRGPVVDLHLMHFYPESIDSIPYYWYEICIGNQPIGKISLHIGYNETILVNGHVGYEINSDYRGHHYGYYAVEMIKSLAIDHGFRYLILTAAIDNLQSQKIIRRAGGKLILRDYEVPKDHIFYVLGKPKMNIYEIQLGY